MAIVNVEDYYFVYGGGGVGPEPATRWAPKFNGVSNYFTLDLSIALRDGATVEFWMHLGVGDLGGTMLSRSTFSNRLNFAIEDNYSISTSRCTAAVDGVVVDVYPDDGIPHKITITGNSFGIFDLLGVGTSLDNFSNAIIWDMVITGSDQGDSYLALNEGFSSYPNLTSNGDLTVTAVNFTENDVVEIEA